MNILRTKYRSICYSSDILQISLDGSTKFASDSQKNLQIVNISPLDNLSPNATKSFRFCAWILIGN